MFHSLPFGLPCLPMRNVRYALLLKIQSSIKSQKCNRQNVMISGDAAQQINSLRREMKERATWRSRSRIPSRDTKMAEDEWIKTLADGRKVKFFYQELMEDGAFISAKIEGNDVIYSIILTKARNPLSCKDAECHFKNVLSQEQ